MPDNLSQGKSQTTSSCAQGCWRYLVRIKDILELNSLVLKMTRDLNEIIINLDTFCHSLYPTTTDRPVLPNITKAIGRVSFELLRLNEFTGFNVDELNIPSTLRTIRSLTCGKRFVYERDMTKSCAEWSVLEEYEMMKDLRGKPAKEILRWYCSLFQVSYLWPLADLVIGTITILKLSG
jgi:hypothetical protein